MLSHLIVSFVSFTNGTLLVVWHKRNKAMAAGAGSEADAGALPIHKYHSTEWPGLSGTESDCLRTAELRLASALDGETTLELTDLSLISLPNCFERFPSLKYLFCGGNILTSLPDTICACSDLKRLDCSDNRLETLPGKLGDCAKLSRLWCYENELVELPETLSSCRRLKVVSCAINKIARLPEGLDACRLTAFTCSVNRITALPDSLGRCKELCILHCDANLLTNIPESFAPLFTSESPFRALVCRDNPWDPTWLNSIVVAGGERCAPAQNISIKSLRLWTEQQSRGRVKKVL